LSLANVRLLSPLPVAETPGAREEALARLDRLPVTIDEYGTRAFWDAGASLILATGALDNAVPILRVADGQVPTDLAIGHDGVLYVTIEGRVVMQDLRNRWDNVVLAADGFTAWRLAAHPAGGVWVLDRENRGLARVRGLPLPVDPRGSYSARTFRPCPENPDPPRLIPLSDEVGWASGEEPVAIACSQEGCLAVLSWVDGDDACLRCLEQDGAWLSFVHLIGARYPYGLAWVSPDRVAVLLSSVGTEAPAYHVTKMGGGVQPVGDLYPLRDHDGGPFANGVSLPPHYPTHSGTAPLYRLSLPLFAHEGVATKRKRPDGLASPVSRGLYPGKL
jgi:hypothetical protein